MLVHLFKGQPSTYAPTALCHSGASLYHARCELPRPWGQQHHKNMGGVGKSRSPGPLLYCTAQCACVAMVSFAATTRMRKERFHVTLQARLVWCFAGLRVNK